MSRRGRRDGGGSRGKGAPVVTDAQPHPFYGSEMPTLPESAAASSSCEEVWESSPFASAAELLIEPGGRARPGRPPLAPDDATTNTLGAAPAFGTSDLRSLAAASEPSGAVFREAEQAATEEVFLLTRVRHKGTRPFRIDDIAPPRRFADVAQPFEANIGGYHVHHRLKGGGMADVFLARAPGLDRDVLIKRLRDDVALADERNLRVFRREAHIASLLVHENIVRIIDHAGEGAERFIVMELLDGYDLRDLAVRCWGARLPVPVEGVLSAIADAARGLAYAHAGGGRAELAGLVHRDVSPENLFLCASGVGKVLDFGIAIGASTERFTRTGEVKGKVPYLAPETILGAPLQSRTDVFSLCTTAYFLLSGRHPFTRSSPLLTLKAIVEETPPPLSSQAGTDVPAELTALVMRALHKEAHARPPAVELAWALEDLLAHVGRREAASAWVRCGDLCRRPERAARFSPAAVSYARWQELAKARAQQGERA